MNKLTRKKKLVNRINDAVLLGLIREKGPMSRKDMAEIVEVHPSTITRITNRLIASRLLREGDEISTGSVAGGRRPVHLEINSNGGYLLGLEIGAWKIKSVITDLSCRTVLKSEKATMAEEGRESIIGRIYGLIDETIQKAGVPQKDLKGIGIGVTGIVDNEEGVSVFAAHLKDWREVPLKKMMMDRFGVDTIVTNDMTVTTLGEKYYGEGQSSELKDLICFNWGMGIASGVISHEELLLSGRTRHVGNIGHLTIDKRGPMCACGNRGCLEAYAGGRAIVRVVQDALKNGTDSLISELAGDPSKISCETVLQAAREGDKLATDVLKEAAKHVGFGVAILVQVYSPDKVVFCGGMMQTGGMVVESVKEAAHDHLSDGQYAKVELVVSRLGEYAGALGAARLIAHEVFNVPLLALLRA